MTRHRSQVCRCSFMTVVKLLLLLLFFFFFWKFILNFHRSMTDLEFINSSLPIWSKTKMLTFSINYQWNCWFDWKSVSGSSLMADLMSFIVCHFYFFFFFYSRREILFDGITAATNRWIWFADYTTTVPKAYYTLDSFSFELLKVILWRSMDIALDAGWMDSTSLYVCAYLLCLVEGRPYCVSVCGLPAKKKKKK